MQLLPRRLARENIPNQHLLLDLTVFLPTAPAALTPLAGGGAITSGLSNMLASRTGGSISSRSTVTTGPGGLVISSARNGAVPSRDSLSSSQTLAQSSVELASLK